MLRMTRRYCRTRWRVGPWLENTGRKQDQMTFQPGKSGNPAGKPAGARNKTTLAVEALLDGEAEGLTRKAIELANAGDIAAFARHSRAAQ